MIQNWKQKSLAHPASWLLWLILVHGCVSVESSVPTNGQPADENELSATAHLEPQLAEVNPAQSTAAQQYELDLDSKITGHVVFPEGTPDDELCEVLLLSKSLVPSVSRFRFPNEWYEDLEQHVVARVAVDVKGDGAFEFPIPVNASGLFLVVRGRYLYSRNLAPRGMGWGTSTLDGRARTLPQVLKPELGCWVTLALQPPTDSAYVGEQLVGRDFSLNVGSANDVLGIRHRTSKIDSRLMVDFFYMEREVVYSEVNDFESLGQLAPFVLPQWELNPKQREFEHVDRGEASFPMGNLNLELHEREIQPGQHLRIDVPLVDGLALGGVVVDAVGEPLENAELSVQVGFTAGPRPVHRSYKVKTDSSGRFLFRGLEPSLTSMRIDLRGYFPLDVKYADDEVDLGRLDLRYVLRRGHVISGRVVHTDGSPAVAMPVRAFSNADILRETATDQDGSFELRGLIGESYDLHAGEDMTRSFSAARGPRVDKLDVGANTRGHRLVLKPTSHLNVSVVDETGEPMSQFEIAGSHRKLATYPLHGNYGRYGEMNIPVNTQDGHFQLLGLSAGTWDLWIKGSDGALSEMAEVVVTSSPQSVELVLPGAQ